MANNLLMPGLSYFRHKLFEFQAFHNQAHITNFTGIIMYFCGTYYLYALAEGAKEAGEKGKVATGEAGPIQVQGVSKTLNSC